MSNMTNQMTKILFPGSFDPFTTGHADLVERALEMFDSVIIAIGYNEQKTGYIPVQERIRALAELYHDNPHVLVVSYTCLTADIARQLNVQAILRGVRSVKDYEYEMQMADLNRQLCGIDTVVLFTKPELASISSSAVRELAHFGHDITPYLPKNITYKL